jgi:hypothetical protein
MAGRIRFPGLPLQPLIGRECDHVARGGIGDNYASAVARAARRTSGDRGKRRHRERAGRRVGCELHLHHRAARRRRHRRLAGVLSADRIVVGLV